MIKWFIAPFWKNLKQVKNTARIIQQGAADIHITYMIAQAFFSNLASIFLIVSRRDLSNPNNQHGLLVNYKTNAEYHPEF